MYLCYRYTWKRNFNSYGGVGDRVFKLQNHGTLVFNTFEASDVGIYQCFANNTYGTAVSLTSFVREAKLYSFPETPRRVTKIYYLLVTRSKILCFYFVLQRIINAWKRFVNFHTMSFLNLIKHLKHLTLKWKWINGFHVTLKPTICNRTSFKTYNRVKWVIAMSNILTIYFRGCYGWRWRPSYSTLQPTLECSFLRIVLDPKRTEFHFSKDKFW